MNKYMKIFGLLTMIIAVVMVAPGLISGSTQILTVMSESMSPAIGVGDVIIVKSVDPATLKIGDIITYAPQKYGVVITHRIIDIEENGDFVTKGDANRRNDINNVDPAQVIGKCDMILPYLGYLTHYARQPIGFIILILVPTILLIVIEIRSAIKNEVKTVVNDKNELNEYYNEV